MAALLIVGSGAVATLFVARLASVGVEVKMLAGWQEAISTIRKRGVQLIFPDGREISAPVEITDDLSELDAVQDAIVLVKSWQTERAALQLKECLKPDGLVLTLQNGLGNAEILAGILGAERTAAGVVVLGAHLIEPGCVKTTGDSLVQLGNRESLGGIENCLRKAGFRIEKYADIESLQWGKLIVNSAINPPSALLQVSNGELMRNPHAHALLIELAREGEQIAAASGIKLPYLDVLATIESILQKTAENFSSMLQDRMRNAPTEIEAINGSLLRFAEMAGVNAPFNRCMVHLIRALSQPAVMNSRDEQMGTA